MSRKRAVDAVTKMLGISDEVATSGSRLGVDKALSEEIVDKAVKKKRTRKKKAAAPKAPKAPKTKSTPRTNNVDLANKYYEELEAAGLDKEKFKDVFKRMSEDPNINNREMNIIGERYLKMPEFKDVYKSEKKAGKLNQIRMTFQQKESVDVYARIIRSTNPWQ